MIEQNIKSLLDNLTVNPLYYVCDIMVYYSSMDLCLVFTPILSRPRPRPRMRPRSLIFFTIHRLQSAACQENARQPACIPTTSTFSRLSRLTSFYNSNQNRDLYRPTPAFTAKKSTLACTRGVKRWLDPEPEARRSYEVH